MSSRREWSTHQLRLYPELKHFERTDPLAARWCRPLRDGWWTEKWTGLFAVTVWTFVCLGLILACFGFAYRTGSRSMGSSLVAIIVGVVIAWLPGSWIVGNWSAFQTRRYARRILRSELRRRGIPICIACGYEGGDITTPRCPECGGAHGT